jgi:hypothetical protein
MPYIIDGKAISKQIKDELRDEVEKLTEAGINACLAVIQVGNDPASTVYVNNKKKACAYVGINSRSYELPEDTAAKVFVLAKKMATKMTEKLHCDGLNIVQNNGEAAGQTVRHFHMHLIPRYENDGQHILWNPGKSTPEELEEIRKTITE